MNVQSTSISSNIAYWKDEVIATEIMIIAVQTNLNLNYGRGSDREYQKLIAEKMNLKYELKEMKKNLNFWLWVNKNFGQGYEETFSYPMEDDE